MNAAAVAGLWTNHPDSGSTPWAFAAALAVAGALHLALLLGVSFELPETVGKRSTGKTLEVMVLRQAAPSEKEPEIADAFAQVDREGGGAEEVAELQASPDLEPLALVPEPAAAEPPALPIAVPIAQPVDAEPPPLPEQVKEPPLTATLDPEPVAEVAALPAPTLPKPEPPIEPELEATPEPKRLTPTVTAAQIMASRSLEIAELTSRIEQTSSAYSKRKRRKAISASTREYKYANYLEAWRRKVERIGNLNYPDEAKKHSLYGTLILHVGVRADGSIERIRVLRSSGFDVLDEAAIRIVELAAPFSPFPPDIKAETDVLDITRTWQFLRSNRLGWDN